MSTTRDPKVQTAPHAGTILPNGDEECLGCGKSWPCDDAQLAQVGVLAPSEPTPGDVVSAAIRSGVPWPLVAAQLGLTEKSVQDYIDAAK